MTREPASAADRLEAMLARLPAEIAPPGSLWMRIETALTGPGADTDALLQQMPEAVEPPRDLWPEIRDRLAQAPGHAGSVKTWHRAAAAVGCLTLVAMVGLSALRLSELADELPTDQSRTAPAAADIGWPVQFDRLRGTESIPAAASLRGTLDTIRDDYEMTRRQRLTIEEQMQDNLDNANLQALWRHTYEAELALTSEAERILGNL